MKQVLYIGVPGRKVSDLGGPKLYFKSRVSFDHGIRQNWYQNHWFSGLMGQIKISDLKTGQACIGGNRTRVFLEKVNTLAFNSDTNKHI